MGIGELGGDSVHGSAAWRSPDATAEVLAPRAVAGMIDIAALFTVFVVLSVLFGGAHSGRTGVSVSLSGWPFLLFIAASLAYYFGLETLFGQTLGKRMLGLRVVGLDGRPPTARAVLVRTLARAIDVLPMFYLVGFIALSTGRTPRQRIGDHLARTTVELD